MADEIPLNRADLKAFAASKLIDNVMAAITPEDARDVINKIIDSTGLLVEELAKKADLVDGKVPIAQLPVGGVSGIAAWSNTTTYTLGAQVTFADRIWQSKINNNLNIEPFQGDIWTEVSPTHLQNTDSMLRLPDGTPLTAQYIVDNLGGKPVYKNLITIAPATASVIVDPVTLVPAEYDLAEIVFLRQAGVACTVTIPGYAPIVIPAATEKTFQIRILRFTDTESESSIYYCFTSLSNGSGAGVTDGDKTDIVVSGSNWLVKASRILGQVLTGVAATTGDIVATDTITLAFGKVINFISTIGTTIRGTVMTGLDVNQAGTPAATDTLLQIIGKLSRLVNALGVAQGIFATTLNTSILDFAFRFHTVSGVTTLAITSFSNQGLGLSVKIIVPGTVTSFSVSVAGWTAINTGFAFRSGVVNIVDIIILPGNQYEIFIDPVV